MARKSIPDLTGALVLSANARVCCVCKARGLGTNFHHIDHDPSNNDPANLAVLCVRDHDAHHRPLQYPALNHLELGAEAIRRCKADWERFVAEARQPTPGVLAVLNVYGQTDYVHSMRLLFQWADGPIAFERMYHLTDGPFERWADAAVEEVAWLGSQIELVLVNEPLQIDHCPCCGHGLSNRLNTSVGKRLTAPDWDTVSVGSVYISPTRASLAINIAYSGETLTMAHLHRCGNYLHFVCENYEERVPIRRRASVRTQAGSIVRKFIRDWQPSTLFFGTGDPDAPIVVTKLELPQIWER